MLLSEFVASIERKEVELKPLSPLLVGVLSGEKSLSVMVVDDDAVYCGSISMTVQSLL